MTTKAISFRHIDAELWRQVKIRSLERDISLKDAVESALRAWLQQKEKTK
jgi:hypothetical protein